jgi:hypothetical protein
LLFDRRHFFRNSSGYFTTFTAIRRASFFVSSLAAEVESRGCTIGIPTKEPQ